MKRPIFIFASLMIIATMVLAACTATPTAMPATQAPAAPATQAPAAPATQAPAPTATMAPATAAPVTLTVWDCYHAGGTEEASITSLVKTYMTNNPNVTINLLEIPFDQCYTKYETDTAAGGGPDMFTAPNDNLGSEVRANLIAPIDSLLQGKLDGYTQAGIAGVTVDGKIYAVPGIAKAVGVFYNKSTVPTPPATTDDLMALVKAGKKVGFINNGAYFIWGFWSGFGGTLMDSTGKCVADQTTGYADALQYLADFQKAGGTIYTDEGKAETAFEQGQLDVIFDGPWVLGDFEKALGANLGATTEPAGPKGPMMPMMGIDGWYINPNSQNQTAAVAAALYFFGKDGLTTYENTAGDPGARSDVTSTDPLVTEFATIAAGGFPRPQSAEFGNYWGPFGDAMTAVFSGKATATAAVATACATMNTANKK
jgi:arabinogalactan oligomer / maltooligosaccharide transport system substrate-binding protein